MPKRGPKGKAKLLGMQLQFRCKLQQTIPLTVFFFFNIFEVKSIAKQPKEIIVKTTVVKAKAKVLKIAPMLINWAKTQQKKVNLYAAKAHKLQNCIENCLK